VASQVLSVVSLVVALLAVSVAVWQIRSNVERSKKTSVIDVVADRVDEFRSDPFRASLRNMLSNSSAIPSGCPFEEIPETWRDDAYKICYYFENIAAFIVFDIIEEDLIISLMGSQIMQVWVTMGPFIESERRYRQHAFPPDASTDFLPHFQSLVNRIRDLGGTRAPSKLRARAGIRPPRPISVPDVLPANDPAATS
jgi:ferritin-like protein